MTSADECSTSDPITVMLYLPRLVSIDTARYGRIRCKDTLSTFSWILKIKTQSSVRSLATVIQHESKYRYQYNDGSTLPS